MAPPVSKPAPRVAQTSVRSDELEKLLNSWGAPGGVAYDAEAMIDQLLANTWGDAPSVRRGSLKTGQNNAGNASRTESFKQQTKSMNELEEVLSDSIQRLLRHRQTISDRIAALEKDNQKVASKFQDGLKNPEQLLTMEDLEERFTKVSSTAVVIGDRLASLDQERARVLDTDEILEALLALNEPTAKPGMAIRSNNRLYNTLQDKNQLHEAAKVIKKMLVFSTELSSPLISVAVNEIERLSQTIENDLLTEFSDAQERDQTKAMRKCAESLIEYNDKDKVADRYVWNVMKDRLATAGAGADMSLDPIQDLDSLFAKILAICRDQFAVIAAVFPAATCTSIRELLVERLFNDPAFGILSFLDQVLNGRQHHQQQPASPRSAASANPEYVTMLCAAYERACALALQVEQIELPSVAQHPIRVVHTNVAMFSPLKEATELVATPPSSTTQDSDRDRMRAFLALQLHSLFGSHRQKYFHTELELLQSQFKELFDRVKFPSPVVAIKQKTNKSTASKPPLASNSSNSALQTPPTPTTATATNSSATNVLPPSSTALDKDSGVTTTEMATLAFVESLLAIAQDEELPAKYTGCLAAALNRCDVVLKDSEMRGELVTKAFATLLASYADEFAAKLVAMTFDLLQEPMVSAAAPRQVFTLLEPLLKRVDCIDEAFEALVAPRLADSPTQLTICYEAKRKCLEKIERALAAGLQQVLTVVDKQVASLLAASQDKADFLGTETTLSLSCSKACRKCTDVLQPLVTSVSTVLLAENRDHFLIALAALFKDLYLQHLHKFRFDPDGAIMLLRDVNAYRQIFHSVRHDAIDASFDLLHEVANVFAMPPENVGSFVRDGRLASMPKQSLVELLKRRWDYKTQADKMQL